MERSNHLPAQDTGRSGGQKLRHSGCASGWFTKRDRGSRKRDSDELGSLGAQCPGKASACRGEGTAPATSPEGGTETPAQSVRLQARLVSCPRSAFGHAKHSVPEGRLDNTPAVQRRLLTIP